jgi:hypothetical protein
MSGNKKDSKTNVPNTTKKNEEEESAELVRLSIVIFLQLKCLQFYETKVKYKKFVSCH